MTTERHVFHSHQVDQGAYVLVIVYESSSCAWWEFAIERDGVILHESAQQYGDDTPALRDGLTWWLDCPDYLPLSVDRP